MTTDFSSKNNRELVDDIWMWLMTEAGAREHRQRAEQEAQRRMEATGASEIPHPTLECKLVQAAPTYDPSILRQLYELLPREVVDEVMTPAHEEVMVVPERWDARRFKGLAKYGSEVAGVVLKARLPSGPPRLRVAEKKP